MFLLDANKASLVRLTKIQGNLERFWDHVKYLKVWALFLKMTVVRGLPSLFQKGGEPGRNADLISKICRVGLVMMDNNTDHKYEA